ncbi:MAG TPA: hypothetical protein VGC20_03220 [bacterium]|jgi:hypothetical protein
MTSQPNATHDPNKGRVLGDKVTRSVLLQVPCAHGPQATVVALSPADARHLATLLLQVADQLEPSS